MTNREYLAALSDEELARSFYFCVCPIGEIYRKSQAEKGNIICQRDELIKTCEAYTYDFHKNISEICVKCKAKWLSAEKTEY